MQAKSRKTGSNVYFFNLKILLKRNGKGIKIVFFIE
jgi:hypothetical protein